MNTENPNFLKKFGKVNDLTDQDWLNLLAHNPNILKVPIVMKGTKIGMMSNPQKMLHFLE